MSTFDYDGRTELQVGDRVICISPNEKKYMDTGIIISEIPQDRMWLVDWVGGATTNVTSMKDSDLMHYDPLVAREEDPLFSEQKSY